MQMFKVTGRMIFRNAFELTWNWNILLILKKYSWICTEQMQNKLMQIHKTSDYESSFESSPSHVWSSIVKPNYSKQPCFKLQSLPANRSCIVWHVKNDAYWNRRFVPRGVHRNNMQVLVTCNIFERSAKKSCHELI